MNVLITDPNSPLAKAVLKNFSKEVNLWGYCTSEVEDGVRKFYKDCVGSFVDLKKLFKDSKIDIVFHLASLSPILSEQDPKRAHKINVDETAIILDMVAKKVAKTKETIKFIFPSTIAVYNTLQKDKKSDIKESHAGFPITYYGMQKLYCENMGIYYEKKYQALFTDIPRIDFRAIRLPGIIGQVNAEKARKRKEELLHNIVSGDVFRSYVKKGTKVPFILLPDAARGLFEIAIAKKENLTKNVYNVSGFSADSDQIAQIIKSVWGNLKIEYSVDPKKQEIIDSWPDSLDDSSAREDWQWSNKYDYNSAGNYFYSLFEKS